MKHCEIKNLQLTGHLLYFAYFLSLYIINSKQTNKQTKNPSELTTRMLITMYVVRIFFLREIEFFASIRYAVSLCKKSSNHQANHTPGNVQFYIVTTWETPGNHWCWWPNTLIITLASARAIIKVSGHQHQWFQVFPRWLQCKTVHFQGYG